MSTEDRIIATFLGLISLPLLMPNVCQSGDWQSFQNGGKLSETAVAGSTVPEQFETRWMIDLQGYGQSSPVLWGDIIFVTSVEGPQKETYHIAAYRAKTSEKLWSHELKNASPQESTTYVSKAAPTPVVDATGVYAFFEGGNLLKLNHQGELVWERNLVEEFGSIESRHGLGASLEQNADSLFVWVERSEEPYLLAVDKATGQDHWKTAGVGATSWSSPRLIPVSESESHLVLSAIGSLTGIDPVSGKVLWSFDQIAGNSTPTPVPLGEGKFLIGATVGRGGKDEGLRPAESNGVVEIQPTDAGWQVKFIWRAEEATSSFGSPIAHDGSAFFVNKTGVLFCLDARTGKELAKARIGGSLWATPFAIGSRLYLFTKDGLLKIYSTGSDLKQIGERTIFEQPENAGDNPFGGKTLYAAIRVDDGFIVRSGTELYCLQPVSK